MKHFSVEAKLDAYNQAINYLLTEECSYDKKEDIRARHWLANKLNTECTRWYGRLKKRGEV